MKPRFTLLPLAFASAVMATHVYANTKTTNVEEIIVTGELRQASALTMANSVAVVDQTQIEARQAQNLEDILNLAANVNFSTGASRGRFIQIRGIGERSQYVDPVNPSVGIMVDGIDFTGIGTGVTALDTQQIEVFRGPQATLFGANALAGMINVKGNAPSLDAASARIKLGAGNYNSRNSSAVLNAPLGDSLGWRFGIQKNRSDGYIKNDYLNRKDTNDIDELSLRNQFVFNASDTLQFNLISYFIDVNNGYDAFSLDNSRHTLSDQPGADVQKTTANALSMNYSGLKAFDISATLTHADSDLEYGFDEDWSYIDICKVDDDCAYWQYSTTDN
jgi:outer membrane receptor protein involved in Fe transport